MWTQIVGLVAGPLVKLIDELHTSDEEKAQIRKQMQEIILNAELRAQELELSFEQNITKRHAADMQSDSWLSKNIRPLILIFLSTVFVAITFFDGNILGFQIKAAYVSVYETLLMTAYGFYFGSRAIEKTTKIFKGTVPTVGTGGGITAVASRPAPRSTSGGYVFPDGN